jgi:hypothetical protein
MAIFYLPYLDPATGLSVTSPPAAKVYAYGDIYVSSAGAPYFRNGPPTGTLVTWTKYVSNIGPGTLGLAYSSTVPPLIASALVTTKNLNLNQTVDFDIGSVYGGSAITSSFAAGGTVTGLSATISPALPAGLTLTKVFSTVTIGANVYNSLKLSITGAATAVTPLTSYKITVKDATNLTASLSFDLSTTAVSILSLVQAVPSKIETVGVAEVGFTPIVASGGSGALTYTISPALPSGLIIDSATGEITGTGTVASSTTTYTVTVKDSASPPQSKSETFSLSVVSIPIVTKIVIPTKVLQQNIAATSFTPVTATGGTGALSFTVSPTLPTGLSFSSSGAITGTPTSSSASTLYTVTVKDSSPIPLTATASFALSVDALAALVTTQVVPTTTLTKNIAAPSFTPVTASGGYGTLTYSISPALPSGLIFSTTTGAISGTPTGTSTTTTYTVSVTDQASQSSSKTFSLSVSATALTASLDIPFKTVTSNVAVLNFTPVTATGGTGTITYSITPSLYPLLNFSTTTGEISGTSSDTHGNTTYVITATDQTPTSVNKTFYLTINAPTPLVTTTVIPSQNVIQGEAATGFSPVTASGGYGTLSWSTTPSLPTGLSINGATGAISGTAGSYANANTYTVVVQDQAKQISNSTFSLTIDAPTLILKQAVPSKTIYKNIPVTEFTPVTATGGTGIYTYGISPPLPYNLTFSTTTGKISGTAFSSDSARLYTVTITDSLGKSGSKTFYLTIDVAATISTTTVVPYKTVIKLVDSVNFTPVTASGGYGTITFAITPTLPTGLSFNTNNGIITGLASVKSSNTLYTVTVTDAISQNSNSSFYLTSINQPLLTNRTTVGNTQVYQYLAITPFTPVEVKGGFAPYSYSISPNLPNYIEFNTNSGVVTGNSISISANSQYTITVTDSEGSTNTNTFIFGVTTPPTLSSNTVVPSINTTINLAVTETIPVIATGGYQPLTYSVSPSLPASLKLNSTTGAISGISTSISANTLYVMTATDILSNRVNSNFYLTTSASKLSATVNLPTKSLVKYKQTDSFIPVVGVGGLDPLNYTISPSLPGDLVFNTTTGEITGTSKNVSGNTFYVINITDTANQNAQSGFYLTVTETLPITLEATIQVSNVNIYQGDYANVTPVVGVGGTGAYRYSISPTTLPDGLFFDILTGTISGTSTVTLPSSNYTITVNDQVPQYKSQTITILVESTPASFIDREARKLAGSKASLAFYKIVANGNAITATSNADTVYINANVANGIIVVANTDLKTINLSLSNILANAGTYGANNQIPIITVGYDGRISNVSTANIDTTTALIALTRANDAYNQANTANTLANNAYIVANAAYTQANTANTLANNAYIIANAAYTQANTANTLANNAYMVANAAFAKTNSGSTVAQSAFDAANTKLSLSGGTVAGNVIIQKDLSVLGNVNFIGNVTSIAVSGNSGQFYGYAANGFNAFYAGIPVGYLVQGQMVQQLTANYDGYAGLNMQNINSGANASFDVFITADNGSASEGYLDLGLASSNYNYIGDDFDLIQKNDGYLFTHGNTTTLGGNTIIGSYHNDVVISANGMGKSSEIVRISSGINGKTVTITGNLTSNSVNTKSISINGTDVATQINAAFAQANVVPTLQEVTEQGASTFIPVRIRNNTISFGITSGALVVDGGIASKNQISANNLFVVGQANIASELFVGGDLRMSNNTTIRVNSGSTTRSPIKLTGGTLKTDPLNGDMEFDGGQLYITVNSNQRKAIATSDKVPFGAVLQPVRSVVTSNVSVYEVARNTSNLELYDGVVLGQYDRVLFTGQGNPIDNGIYVFQGEGQFYIRSSDMNVDSNTVGGTMVSVSDGIKYQESVWILATVDPIKVTSDPLLWDRIVSRDSISISNLSNSPGILTKVQDGSIVQRTITANVAAGLLVTNGTGGSGNPQVDVSVIPVSHGGTGVTNTADLLDALGVAGAGVNSNITELAGLTKGLRVAFGGTGAFDGRTGSNGAYYGRLGAKKNLLLKPNQYGVTASGTYSDQLSWPSQNSATVYTEGFGTDYVLTLKMPDSPQGSTYAGTGDFIDFKTPYPTMVGKQGQKLTVVETYNSDLNYWTRQAQWKAAIDVGFDYANNRYDTANVGMSLMMDQYGQIQWSTPAGGGTVIGVRGEAVDSDITVINYNTTGNSVGYITSNGRINIALNTITHSKLPVVQMTKGGTGNPSIGTGYLYSNGTIVTANIHIPGNTISGNLLLSNMNVQHGGTGANNRVGAMINLLPSYVGNNGKALLIKTDGSDVEWVSPTGVGTVTSVGIRVPNDNSIIIGNSPITAAGNITMSLGVVPTGNGGTGNNALTSGYVYSTGPNSPMTSNIYIPGSVISGNISGAAGGLIPGIVVPLRNGGTGAGGSNNDDTNRREAKNNLLILDSQPPNHRDVFTYWNPPGSSTQDKITWQPLWPTPDTTSSNPVFANTRGINYSQGMSSTYLLAPFLRYNPANPYYPGTSDIALSWEYPYPSPNGVSNTVLTHVGNNELAWTATSQGIVRTVLSSSFTVTTANLGQTVFINTPTSGLAIANGGTGATSRISAINNLLPPQVNEYNGWVLFTDGANAYWQSVPGTGTVTSVGLQCDPGEPFSISGSPITAAGTFNLTLGTVPLSKGGTGATTIGAARTNLGAAKSGVNSDITRLTGLVTPLAVTQGGTGTNNLTGYIKGNGTGAFTAVSSIPAEDLGVGTLGMQNSDAAAITGGSIENTTLRHVVIGNNYLGMSTVGYSVIKDSVITSNVKVTLDEASITGNTVLSGNVVIQSDLSVSGDITTTSNLHANYIQADNNIVANGNLFIYGNSKVTGTANVGSITANNGIYLNPISWMSSNTYTTSGLSQVAVDQFSAANFRSAKYFIQITSGTRYHATELTMIHDDANAYISQFGTVKSSVILGTFNASVVAGALTLNFTPTFSNTTLKMHRTTIRK